MKNFIKNLSGGKFAAVSLGALALGLSLFSPLDANAIKARPGIIEFTQPDGSVVPIRLHGDERSHFTTSENGILLLTNADGYLEYALKDENGNPKLSGVTVKPYAVTFGSGIQLFKGDEYAAIADKQMQNSNKGMKAPRQSDSVDKKYVYSTSAFPTEGAPHSIVVLVEYPDYRFSMDDPASYYEDFLNGNNFTKDNGTGSCRQYFVNNSNGIFQPTYDVYGPIRMQNNRRYYGAGNELHAPEMVVEAVQVLDPFVDFSKYDHNNDGYVDSIFIIYAHKGEADSGITETVWPHSWELEYANLFVEVDGVKVNTYGCSNEIDYRNKVNGIGAFVHEFCHVMGLPDLYHTTSYTDATPCDWSVLDSGPYNNDGRTPPNMSAFERYSLGWIKPEEILCSGDYQLENLADIYKAYMMTTEENTDEFYVLENRQLKGWDLYLPHHGMLVWHIDFNQAKWDANTVNNTTSHQNVKLVCADNITGISTLRGDAFPGPSNVTKLTSEPTSSPRLVSWANKPLNVTSIASIAENNSIISFTATATEDRKPHNAGIGYNISDTVNVWAEYGAIYTSEGSFPVYDISGRMIGNVSGASPLAVSNGIYIVAGKKIMVK